MLVYLRASATRMRRLAVEQPSAISPDLLRIADEIAADAATLESELVAAGLLSPATANEA